MAEEQENVLYQKSSKTEVEWNIKDFINLHPGKGEYLESPPFWVSNVEWRILFWPDGDTDDKDGYISLYLEKITRTNPLLVSYRLSIKVGLSVLVSVDDKYTFDDDIFNDWGYLDFIERSEILKHFNSANDPLIIECSVENITYTDLVPCSVSCSDKSTSDVKKLSVGNKFSDDETANGSKKLSNVQGVQALSNNLKELFISKEHCDVKIKVGSKEFSAHKLILSARSPVFASMFRHEMAEDVNGTLDISDCDPISFEVFLEFLYTGKMDSVCYSNAIGLYKTADKYSVDDLKEECVARLCEGMDAEYVCDILDLAALHEEKPLLETAINFFIENVKDILVTAKWQVFMVEKSTLANECLKKMAEKKL